MPEESVSPDRRSPEETASDPQARANALQGATRRAPYAQKMGMRCLVAEPGFCRVEMVVKEDMVNVFGWAHGGAIFGLLDEACQLACNAHGLTAFALNLSVTCMSGARAGDRVFAEAREVSLTRRTGTYDIRITRENGELVAVAQALARRTSMPLPFVDD